MADKKPENQYGIVYDEDGINEVSEQIMNSYNSGFMGEQEVQEKTEE